MRRSLWICLAACTLAMCSAAPAVDEWDEAYAPVKLTRSGRESVEPAPESRRHSNAPDEQSGLPDELSADTVGSYFGLGDEFAQSEDYAGLGRLAYSRGAGAPSSGPGDTSPTPAHEWNDRPEGYNSGHNHDTHEGYAGENVYGPMWGVPEDAVGLDGFSGNPYPGLMDGVEESRGRESRGRADDRGAVEPARSSEDIQRNHKINRPGGNDD